MSKRGWLLMILGLLSLLLVLPLQVQADSVVVQLTPRPTLVPLPTETSIVTLSVVSVVNEAPDEVASENCCLSCTDLY